MVDVVPGRGWRAGDVAEEMQTVFPFHTIVGLAGEPIGVRPGLSAGPGPPGWRFRKAGRLNAPQCRSGAVKPGKERWAVHQVEHEITFRGRSNGCQITPRLLGELICEGPVEAGEALNRLIHVPI